MHERLPTRSHSTLKRMHIWPEQKEGRQSHSVSEMENGSSMKYPVTCLQLFLALEEITIITLLLLLPHICLIAFFLRSKSHTHNYIISWDKALGGDLGQSLVDSYVYLFKWTHLLFVHIS